MALGSRRRDDHNYQFLTRTERARLLRTGRHFLNEANRDPPIPHPVYLHRAGSTERPERFGVSVEYDEGSNSKRAVQRVEIGFIDTPVREGATQSRSECPDCERSLHHARAFFYRLTSGESAARAF